MKYSFILTYNNIHEKYNIINITNYLTKTLINDSEIIIVEQGKISDTEWLNNIQKKDFIKYIFYKTNEFDKYKGYDIGVQISSSDVLIFHDINFYLKLNNYKYSVDILYRYAYNILYRSDIIKPYKYIYNFNQDDSEKFINSKFNYLLSNKKSFESINNKKITDGIFLMKKEKYLLINGFDFNNYNKDNVDYMFNIKIKKNNLKIHEVNDSCIKLFHEDINNNINPFSIIISCYDNPEYIEECLDSIQEQTYFINNDNYEILIGIDGCYKTLYKILQIQNKYKNLRLFMMKDNKGTYITSNTLLSLVKYDNIIRFDSDDIMMPNMIKEISDNINNNDIIKFKANDFSEDINKPEKTIISEGVIFYKKHVMDIFGGYQPWVCSADSEFLIRANKYNNIKLIDNVLFYRRLHDKSLTNRIDTNYDSEIRKKYISDLEKSKDIIEIDRIINEYIEIKTNINIINKIPISIIISAYNSDKYIEECLDSVQEQTYFINNDNYEILVGVDSCENTLNKLLSIKHKYKNLRLFMMKDNKGTYITSNTLLNLVKYDNIIRFDSDDIMVSNMVETIINNLKDDNVIRFKYSILLDGNIDYVKNASYPHGVIFIKKLLIEQLGGYQPWRCASDTDLLERAKKSNLLKEKLIDQNLFYRRIHSESLTCSDEYGMKSEKRREYKNLIGKSDNIKIERISNEYTEY